MAPTITNASEKLPNQLIGALTNESFVQCGIRRGRAYKTTGFSRPFRPSGGKQIHPLPPTIDCQRPTTVPVPNFMFPDALAPWGDRLLPFSGSQVRKYGRRSKRESQGPRPQAIGHPRHAGAFGRPQDGRYSQHGIISACFKNG